MAGRAFPASFERIGRTLPGALIRRGLVYAPRFAGRARRTELALTAAACIAAGYVLGAGVIGIFGTTDRPDFVLADLLWLSVLTGLPLLAAMIRRLHDANVHGWAIFVAVFPYVGWLILFIWLVKNGTEGANIFGPDPRA